MEDFENTLSEILEVDAVNPDDKLESFECWDSLTILSIIAIADSKYGVMLNANDVYIAQTIGGLKKIITDKRK